MYNLYGHNQLLNIGKTISNKVDVEIQLKEIDLILAGSNHFELFLKYAHLHSFIFLIWRNAKRFLSPHIQLQIQ